MEPNTKEGITIRTMTLADYETIKDLIPEQFFEGEPLFDCIGCEVSSEYHKSMVAAGTCVVAIDEANDGRVVGFVLAEGQTPENIEKHRQVTEGVSETDIVDHIKSLLYKVEVEADIYKHYGVSKLLYSHLTSVSVPMRGKGLGSRLATSAMDLGRAKGYPLMTASCSSFYSARQKEALGMECIYSLKYEDYKDSEGKVVFTPPAPHREISVMAIKL